MQASFFCADEKNPGAERTVPGNISCSREVSAAGGFKRRLSLLAHHELTGHETGGVSKAAGVAAAVEGAVNAGDRFARRVEALHRLQIPTENFQVVGDAHAAAGEVVPRFHTNHVVGTLFGNLHRLILAAELQVVLRFDGLVPNRELLLQTFELDAGLLAEFFERRALKEVLALHKFFVNAFLRPRGETEEGPDLEGLAGCFPNRFVHEDVVAAVGVAGELRRDVADTFLFRDGHRSC